MALTDNEIQDIYNVMGRLVVKYGLPDKVNGDTVIDTACQTLAAIVDYELAQYRAHEVSNGRIPHEGVVALLQSCSEGLRHAGFDHYASTK